MLLKDTGLLSQRGGLYYLQYQHVHTLSSLAPMSHSGDARAPINAALAVALPKSQGTLRLGPCCFTASSKQACSLSQKETLSHPSRLFTANTTLKNDQVRSDEGPACSARQEKQATNGRMSPVFLT